MIVNSYSRMNYQIEFWYIRDNRDAFSWFSHLIECLVYTEFHKNCEVWMVKGNRGMKIEDCEKIRLI